MARCVKVCLYDLIGRLTDEDARSRSVRAMQGRYHVDVAQAERVEATVLDFLAQTQKEWGLEDPFAALVMSWAAKTARNWPRCVALALSQARRLSA